MPDLTTNYNLKKPQQIENYNVDDFNDNADIIDTQLKANADADAAHKAETVSYQVSATRDISLSGDQTISMITGRTPKTVRIDACINGTDVLSFGSVASNRQGCISRDNTGYSQAVSYCIYLKNGENSTTGSVAIVNGDIIITWSKVGSPTGNTNMIITAEYHD